MASYELHAFDRAPPSISVVAAVEQQSPFTLNAGYWIRDPDQLIQYPDSIAGHPRRDYLWQQTCFEIFVGVQHQDFYREINLSPSQAWQVYQFEEYRYPEDMPPRTAHDIALNQLQRTHYGLNVSLDLTDFMTENNLKWADLFFGLSAVINITDRQHADQQHHYAIQHSSPTADFHNKRDWLHRF
ncbi:DOMON-like domain-containing protein [Acinetobacter sp. WZC-1]|uniref:DOMON-like domain-containing protein n=1 Tax=Acinetobacter sp. WZC-1 TaxID=3459034 RepID=UPI00403D5E3F